MRSKLLLSLAIVAPTLGLAQPAPAGQTAPTAPAPAPTSPIEAESLINVLTARSLGPTNMGGRIMDLAVYEKSPRIFYVATASGGLWKTDNGGTTMTPVFHREGSVSLGAVAVSQRNPDVVWVGTGEGSSRNSTAWGDGVYRSTDGGKTWQNMGLRETMHVSTIIIDPRDDNVVYVGALGRLWGPNPERGVYKTTDGGKTWQRLLFVNELTGVGDMVMDPKNPNVLMAAMWERLRKPYDWTSGGEGSGLYKSTNGGRTWRKITRGLPPSPMGRIGLDYFRKDSRVMVATVDYRAPRSSATGTESPAGTTPATTPTGTAQPGTGGTGTQNPPRPTTTGRTQPPPPNQSGNNVRFNSGGTFISKDGGESWTKVNNLNPRPFYFSTPRFCSQDPNRLYLLAVQFHVSDDQGANFRSAQINVHVDHHEMWVDPSDPNHLILGNDGGVYVSRDRGVRWTHLNNMPIGQFYAVAFDNRKPYWVYGGLQDNGSWGMPTQSRKGGPTFFEVDNVGGGDGFYVAVPPDDPYTIYAESQGGAITRRDLRTGRTRFIQPRAAAGEPRLRFNWSTPFFISPHNSQTVYIGANKLFKSVNRGDSWKAISPDLTTNDPSKQRPGQNSVSPEDTGAERHCTITTLSESTLKQGLIYVGTDDGLVWVTQDDGDTWTNLTANIPNLPRNTWVSRVVASKWTEGRVYATFDGHRENDFRPYVYMSEDYGKTWKSLAAGLPDYDSIYVIREGERNPNLLFLGSEMSLRVSIDRGLSWHCFRGGDFPTVAIHDLAVHPREMDLVIGTHGRSIWTLDISALEQMTPDNLARDLFVARPQNILQLGNVGGPSWDGDQVFASANTQPGTRFHYHLKADAPGEARITVADVAGNVVQSLTGPAKKGLNVVTWRNQAMRSLAPGQYRVTVTVGAFTGTTVVTVEEADGVRARD